MSQAFPRIMLRKETRVSQKSIQSTDKAQPLWKLLNQKPRPPCVFSMDYNPNYKREHPQISMSL